MKNTSVVRRLDELGRITLPIDARRALNIDLRDQIDITIENDRIVLKKNNPSCVFTGKTKNLIEYKGKYIAKETIAELAKIAGLIE